MNTEAARTANGGSGSSPRWTDRALNAVERIGNKLPGLLAEDFIATSSRDAMITRQQVIDAHVHPPSAGTKLESVNFGEMRVRVYEGRPW